MRVIKAAAVQRQIRQLLALAAVAEAATGATLLVVPSLVGQLLLGTELTGVSIPVARVAGISLLSLGLACWPGREPARFALYGMLIYDLLVAFYLLYLGVRGEWVGVLLWPAAALHAVLTALLTRAMLAPRVVGGSSNKPSE